MFCQNFRNFLWTSYQDAHTRHAHTCRNTHANTPKQHVQPIIAMIARNNPAASSADGAPKNAVYFGPYLLLIMLCNGGGSVRDAGVMAALIGAEIEVYSGHGV